MIKPEQLPKEAVAAYVKASQDGWSTSEYCIAAALNAWPGMHTHEWQRPWLGGMSGTDLILPLPPPPAGETRDGLRPDRRTNVAERLFGDDY